MARKKRNKTQRINALLATNPELTPKEIAKRLKVSPNLVHQVKYQTKKNSEFVSKVFAKAKKRPMPERSDDPHVLAAEGRYTDAVKSIYKTHNKPSRLLQSVREMNVALSALKEKEQDLVNKPPHYTTGGIDFLDYAEAKGLTENAYLFNVVKYVSRAGKKVDADPVQDLQKAEFYLKREIERRNRA